MPMFAFICPYQLPTLKKKVTFRQFFPRPGPYDPYESPLSFIPTGLRFEIFCLENFELSFGPPLEGGSWRRGVLVETYFSVQLKSRRICIMCRRHELILLMVVLVLHEEKTFRKELFWRKQNSVIPNCKYYYYQLKQIFQVYLMILESNFWDSNMPIVHGLCDIIWMPW